MDIQFPQILFQLINFSVVLGALTYLLYKPIIKILEERTRKIEQAQKAAQETLSERERLNEIEQNITSKAEKTAAEIVEKAREAAKKTESEALSRAKKKAAAEIEKLTADWQAERKQQVAEMKKEFVNAVVAAAEKVVGADLDAKKHQKLIDQELETLLKSI